MSFFRDSLWVCPTFIRPTGDPSRFSAPPTFYSLIIFVCRVTTKHGAILRVRRVLLKMRLVLTRTYSQGVPIGFMAIMLAMIASMGGVSASKLSLIDDADIFDLVYLWRMLSMRAL